METNKDTNNYVLNKTKHDGIGFAVLLILIGGVFLLLNLDIISAVYKPLLISWQTLLIVIGVWSIFKRNYTSALILILIGLFFIYPKLCIVFPDIFPCADFSVRTYWPLILIIVGILLIGSKKFCTRKKRHYWEGNKTKRGEGASTSAEWNATDFVSKDLVFGASEQIVLSQNFRGGEVSVVFGELIIDLRKAQLAPGTSHLETSTVFGSTVIYLPSDWLVELKGSTVFGGVDDKRYSPQISESENASRLILDASAVFGGCEIRS